MNEERMLEIDALVSDANLWYHPESNLFEVFKHDNNLSYPPEDALAFLDGVELEELNEYTTWIAARREIERQDKETQAAVDAMEENEAISEEASRIRVRIDRLRAEWERLDNHGANSTGQNQITIQIEREQATLRKLTGEEY